MDEVVGDLARHQRGWNGFVRFVTWSIISVVITLALMAFFLV